MILLFGVVTVRLNEKVGIIAFYAILVVSILIFGFGIVSRDNMIIGIGISLFVCAFLELNFWNLTDLIIIFMIDSFVNYEFIGLF